MGNEALDRLLNLATLLLDTSRPLTFEEIRERLPKHYNQSDPETARRQFERDKKALVEIGIQVEMVRGLTDDGVEGYRAAKARALQGLLLSPDELAALHLAVTSVALEGGDSALAAMGKLGGVLGDQGTTVATIEMPHAVGDLFGAVLHRQVATFSYSGVDRELEPHRIGFERGNWYVAGHDRSRGASRNFRIDRIEGPVQVGPAGGFPVPAAREEIRSESWTLGGGPPTAVTVALDREVASAFLLDFPSAAPGPAAPDGRSTVVLEVRHLPGLFSTLLPLLERAEVLDPPEVRAAFVDHLTTLAEAD
ncbi:MAG: helix-turn-helix transcriptional regulator [Actinomycetes bacterium]